MIKTKNLPLLFLICFAVIVMGSLFNFYQKFKEEEKVKKEVYIDQTLDQSVRILERELDKMSIFVSGFRSHVLQSKTELDPDQAYDFIKGQLEFLDYSENIIVNFLDAEHNFVYSVGTKTKVVNNLAGTSVTKIRDQEVIDELDAFLIADNILAFTPMNLYEGHVGLPINFPFRLNENVKGYFAIIVDVKNLLTPIIESDVKDEFTFKFLASQETIEFDREKVYDGTQTYSTNIDPENLHLSNDKYSYQQTTMIGLPFSIGVSYREVDAVGGIMNFVNSILGILMLFLFSTALLCYLYYQNVQKSKDQKVINSKLFKSNDLLKKFIFASSHDLKQPLVNISNFHNLIDKTQSNKFDESGKQYLQVIEDNVDHMTSLLDDLLIYSQVINEEKTKVEINVTEVIEFISASYDKEKVKISFDNISPCHGVKSEITRLFQNLISNAIKYNENDIKCIEISSHHTAEFNVYTVSDNGIGIKKEHQKMVFSEFQRIHKQKYKGTGLGLSICKEIVLNHGGVIKIEDRINEGTSITFSILKK